MDKIASQFQNFKVQLHPPCTVKNTFLNVPEENVSSDEELYTPFERCNMSAPPVLQDPAYVRTDSSAACDYFMRLPGPCSHIVQVSFPELTEEGPRRMGVQAQGQSSKEVEVQKNPSCLDDLEPRPGVQPMKSKGSAGHPDTCKECTFYFFSAAGCRNGADCCFCHEFHPRKNSKKNRRIMRTLQTRESHDDGKEGKEISKEVSKDVCKDIEELPPPKPEAVREAKVQEKTEVKAEESKGVAVDVQQQLSVGGDGMLRVTYSSEDSAADSSAPVALTLIAGVRTCLRPKVIYASPEGQRCLEPTLAFVVQPALPSGLTLDAKTGIISGTPENTSSKAGVHIVTVKVPAQGYGGIALGDVPLTSCKLFVTVRPLQNFTMMKSAGSEVVLVSASDQ